MELIFGTYISFNALRFLFQDKIHCCFIKITSGQ
jgi:hypothetical protein